MALFYSHPLMFKSQFAEAEAQGLHNHDKTGRRDVCKIIYYCKDEMFVSCRVYYDCVSMK